MRFSRDSPLVLKGTDDTTISPLFVTWNTRSSRPGKPYHLRGCIGNFEAMPLHEGLADYALVSAFNDSRFKRIDKSELESLECGYASFAFSMFKINKGGTLTGFIVL